MSNTAKRVAYALVADMAYRAHLEISWDPDVAKELRRIEAAMAQAATAMLESETGPDAGNGVEGSAPVTADLPKAEDAQGRTGVPASLNASEPARPVDRSRSLDEATLWGK